MQLGAVFPQTEIGSDPIAIRDFAQAVEGMGYNYLLAYDHVLGVNPDRPGGWDRPGYTYRQPFHEPLILFSYLAGITRMVGFVTGILILPQRPAALVAKQAAELDMLSGGRLRLGIGLGWNKVEYESLGYEFRNRARRIEEQVTVMRELWTKPLVTFKGQYHTIDDAGINPLPTQRPIPIWFGGNYSDAVMWRIARLGDGWILNPLSIADSPGIMERMKHFLAEAGRTDFGIQVRVDVRRHAQSDWADYVRAWRGLGATHVDFATIGTGSANPQAHIDLMQQFKTTVETI